MIILTPFEGEFCGKIRTIYSVNNDKPKDRSSITTHSYCPNCGKGNFFRVYEPIRKYETREIEGYVYECKCPQCNNRFDIIDEIKKDEN